MSGTVYEEIFGQIQALIQGTELDMQSVDSIEESRQHLVAGFEALGQTPPGAVMAAQQQFEIVRDQYEVAKTNLETQLTALQAAAESQA